MFDSRIAKIRSLRYDRVVTGFDNGGEPLMSIVTLAQPSFDSIAFNKPGSLSGQRIQPLQGPFCGLMPLA
jgi:hypothetical protein